jgi:hypothetical protein
MVVLAASFVAAQVLFFGGVAVLIRLDRARPCPVTRVRRERAVRRAERAPVRLRVRTPHWFADRAPLPYPLPWSYVMARAVATPPRQLPVDVSKAQEMRPAA